MHQVAQIEFENCIFFSFLGETTPSDIPFFSSSMATDFSGKRQNRKRWEEFRHYNSQYLIIENIEFLVKFCQKECTKSRELTLASEGTHQLRHPLLTL